MRIELELDDTLARDAINENGVTIESLCAMEECAEFSKEISKLMRGLRYTKRVTHQTEFTAELADVIITANMLASYYKIDLGKHLPEIIKIKEGEIRRKLNREVSNHGR